MTNTTWLTTKNSSIWWLDEPGGTLYLLHPDCLDLETLEEVFQSLNPAFGWSADRSHRVALGSTMGDPEKIAFDIKFPRYLARSILELGENCPGAIIWTQSECSRVDDITGADIGEIVGNVRKVKRGYATVASRADAFTEVTISMEAWPPLLDIDKLVMGRIATTEANALNDVFGTMDVSCTSDCGTTKSLGEFGGIACDAGAGVTANVLFSTDFAETWAAGAADPFAINLNVMAGVEIPYQGGRRWIVGREGTGAVQGLMAYSDNAGGAWTTVNIGGAAVGHGPVFGHGIFALDGMHIWVASDDGYIYKSINNGVSYVAKEAGTIHVGANYFVHFADKTYGLVGGAAGVISVSSDGGESWTAGGIPAASPARCGWRFNNRRCLVGLDNGALYRSDDGGLTWVLQTTGIPANAMRSMWFVNDYQGFLATNIGGVGAVYKTFDGGTNWIPLTTPANSGINSIWAPSASLVYLVGEANAATGFIAKINAAYV